MLAYSLLMDQLRPGRAKERGLHRLMTIGEARRAMANETLRTPLSWAIEQVTRLEQPDDRVAAQIGAELALQNPSHPCRSTSALPRPEKMGNAHLPIGDRDAMKAGGPPDREPTRLV